MQVPEPVSLVPMAPFPASSQHCARAWVLEALCLAEPQSKLDATHALFEATQTQQATFNASERLETPSLSQFPGRPERPEFIPPVYLPH